MSSPTKAGPVRLAFVFFRRACQIQDESTTAANPLTRQPPRRLSFGSQPCTNAANDPVMPAFRLLPFLLVLLVVTGLRCSQPDPGGGNGPEAFAPSGPPQYRTEGIRIATFNGEFLFDGEGEEGGADFPWKSNPVAARAHRDLVAGVIRQLDADIVVITETETKGVLEMMIAESLSGLGYTAYLVEGRDTFTRQNVGLLSRLPIEDVGRTSELLPVGLTDRLYGVSKNIWAHLTIAGVPATLIGVHFLARPDDIERKPRREVQAEVIRRLVAQEAEAGRAVIALGDFNDFDDATLDIRGSRPITDVLERIKSAGPGADDDLINVLDDVPQRERFTSFYDRNDDGRIDPGEFSAIDHILLSPELYRRLREVHFVHAHDPRLVSDHFPVIVTLGDG